MEWINSLGNMDNTIYGICIMNSYLTLYIKMWDESIKKIKFSNYYAVKEKNSIGREIGDIIIKTSSELIEELNIDFAHSNNIINESETTNIKSIVFYDSWNEATILEIVAENVEFEQ